MGFDSNGTYTRWEGPDTWQKDAAAGTRIVADRHDKHDKDLADALSGCLNRNGMGGALADISMGGHRITNLLDPVGLQDAATLNSVKNINGWDKSKYIGGADINGRLNFTADTGVNGITWHGADLSWVARLAKTNETSNRLVLNYSDTPQTASNVGDVFIIDESGIINNNGYITNNLSYEMASTKWRVIKASSYGSVLKFTDGDFTLSSNDLVSPGNPYSEVALREFFKLNNGVGSTIMTLRASASGKYNAIIGAVAGTTRWTMYLGAGGAESGGPTGRTGSDFVLYAHDNSGNVPVPALTIHRGTGTATLNGDITVNGSLTATGGTLTTTNYLYSSTTSLILQSAASGQVFIRPDGTDTTKQALFTSAGTLAICNGLPAATGGLMAGVGLLSKLGSGGAYGAPWINFNWTGSAFDAYSNTGVIHLQTIACDYRIKKDVEPLPSLWDRVKALRPVSYTQAAFDIWTEDDTVRWGFLAHEVGDDLSPAAVIGEKDGPGAQGLNLITVIAGLTRALQEAMTRIEALEAAP